MFKTPEQKLTWTFGFALLILAGNALVSYRDWAGQAGDAREIARSRDELDRVAEVEAALHAAESARRGCWLDGDPSAAEEFARAYQALALAVAELANHQRVAADPAPRVTAILRAARRCLPRLLASVEQARAGRDGQPGSPRDDDLRRAMADFNTLVADFEDDEERVFADRVAERRSRARRSLVTFSLVSTLALATVGTTYLLVRRHLADQKRIERAVRDSEARFRLLFESVGEGIYGVDTRGRCTFCNPAALRILGFESDRQVLGHNMHRLIHHTHADGTPYPAEDCPIFRTFRTGEGVLGIEDFFHLADGSRVPVEYRAHAIRRGDEILGAVVTFVDIASKRRLETDMRLRERALHAIGQGVFIIDPAVAGVPIVYANSAFERITGLVPGEWAMRRLDPGRDGPLAGHVADLRIALAAGREATVEFSTPKRDATAAWRLLNLYPVDAGSADIGHLVGVLTDITERREHEERLRTSEERLRLMIESVSDYAIFSIDLAGNVSSWNRGAERLFGFTDDEIVGEPFLYLFTPADRAAGRPATELARTGTIGRSADERWHARADGSRFLASGTTTVVRDRSGALIGYTKVARDITHAKQAELELRAAKEAAEAGSRARNTFLSTMGHELRTPLNAIIGYSELLIEEAMEREIPDFVADLDRIRGGGHLLLRLINQVFDLSRIESGSLSLANEPFELDDLIAEVVRSVAAAAERRGNSIQVRCPLGLGTFVGDFAKISQCLGHLLSNAIKFTEGGTVVLKAGRIRDDAARPWLVFDVGDDGIGMTRDEVSRLFQPFVQGDASPARNYGGSGLGLTIMSRFCRLMGGSIEVHSEPGVGSTFEMKIPVVEAPTPVGTETGADGPPLAPQDGPTNAC